MIIPLYYICKMQRYFSLCDCFSFFDLWLVHDKFIESWLFQLWLTCWLLNISEIFQKIKRIWLWSFGYTIWARTRRQAHKLWGHRASVWQTLSILVSQLNQVSLSGSTVLSRRSRMFQAIQTKSVYEENDEGNWDMTEIGNNCQIEFAFCKTLIELISSYRINFILSSVR